MAAAALRDKTLGPKLQRARDVLVPVRLSEAAFWDHFFSHVDVIKVKVTCYPACGTGCVCSSSTRLCVFVSLLLLHLCPDRLGLPARTGARRRG